MDSGQGAPTERVRSTARAPVAAGPAPPREGALALGALALLLALVQMWSFSGRWACIDFYQFWVVGQAVREAGTGDIYSPAERARLGELYSRKALEEARALPPGSPPSLRLASAQHRQVLETYSTPWLYTLFGLLAGRGYASDQALYQGLCLLAFAGSLLTLARLLAVPWPSALVGTLIFLAWFAPHASEIRVGNVNRLQLAFLVLALWLLARPWRGSTVLAGAVLGQAVLFKPNLVFPVLVLTLGWAVLGRWRRLAGLSAGGAAGVLAAFGLASLYCGGAATWGAWAREVPRLLREYDHAIAKGNYALPKLIEHWSGISVGLVWTLLLLALCVVAAFGLRRIARRPGSPCMRPDILLVGLGCAVSVLAADLAWLHYFLFMIPLALWCLRERAPESRGLSWSRALALLAILLLALDPRHLPWPADGTPAAAALVSGAALLLLALALADVLAHARALPVPARPEKA